jgi:uncharacterized protein DUF2568
MAWTWSRAVAALASEAAALVALAWWGATVPEALWARLLLGTGLPSTAALLWGLFAAPRAAVRSTPLLVGTKLVVLGGAIAATAALAGPLPAVVLAVVAAVGAPPADPAALRPPVTTPPVA